MNIKHEHPLQLIDLQPNFPHYEEDYDDDSNDDDDDDVSTQKEFRRRQCYRCRKEINWFHRFYYECKTHSCDYSLHKFCGDLPVTLKHTSHPDHTLILSHSYFNCSCVLCGRSHRTGLIYECFMCRFEIHADCATASTENPLIYHPSHIHPLAAIPKPILSECNACGKKHNGTFYMCVACFDFCIQSDFCIHSDCLFLPKTLRIQETTDKIFSHNHPLILSYSFPKADQEAKFYPKCRVCNAFFNNEHLWIYKCEKCRYYTHLDCATSREEPFMSIISSFGNRLIKNYEDSDHPNLLHLPFPDESYSTLKGHETLVMNNSNNLKNFHQHPLTLVHTSECNDNSKPSSSRTNNNVVSCHNPMTKFELLCNGCVRPITSMPFYKCANENENCNFVLHESCTRVPLELKGYPDHPDHTLIFQPNVPHKPFSIFYCDVCGLACNGFAYSCVRCDYHIDVKCGFIPEKITHEAHPGHILSRVHKKDHHIDVKCRLCLHPNIWDPYSFLCHTCDVSVHVNCALLLPREIRHKCDKHPLSLSYFPVENHKNEYYCEVCEEEFDPQRCFYHCYKCDQSIHSKCAPIKFEFERARYESYDPYQRGIYQRLKAFYEYPYHGVYQFINIKFGGIYNVEGHPHPLLFAQGMKSDGRCIKCHDRLEYEIIFKCEQCNFAVDLECCLKLCNFAVHQDLYL